MIVVSGSWSEDHRRRARELGATRVYSKPVDLAQLARDVKEEVALTPAPRSPGRTTGYPGVTVTGN